MRLDPNKADEIIRSRMVDLGRKHFAYIIQSENIGVAEVFGAIMVETFMQAIPPDEMKPCKFKVIRNAFSAFLSVVMFWLQIGFRYARNRGITN